MGSGSQKLLFLHYETALGSAIHATPVFEAVRAARPDDDITVACAGLSREVLRYNPYIDRLVETPDLHRALAATAWRTIIGLRRERFDAVLTTSSAGRRRYAVLALLSGARRRIGFTNVPGLYHLALRRDSGLSVIADNLRLAEALGAPRGVVAPKMFFSAREAKAADILLDRHAPAGAGLRAVFVTQTSGGQPSQWYEDRFAALADLVSERFGATPLFVGSPGDRTAIDGIVRRMRRPGVSLAGQTDIPTLAALMSVADVAVCLDTGPMHLARAIGLPLVVIAPAWQPAHEWLPLGVEGCIIVRRDDIPCAQCGKFVCPPRDCMDQIAVATVFAAVESLLARHPPSSAARLARRHTRLV